VSAISIIEFYGVNFFTNSYDLKQDDVYEFVLGGIENSSIQSDFNSSDHILVIEEFNKYFESLNE